MTAPINPNPFANVTEADKARCRAARAYVHAATCPRGAYAAECPCVSCPNPGSLYLAIQRLDEAPRDARGVRRILHDRACMSGCGGDEHADATQAKRATALRKWHASEERV